MPSQSTEADTPTRSACCALMHSSSLFVGLCVGPLLSSREHICAKGTGVNDLTTEPVTRAYSPTLVASVYEEVDNQEVTRIGVQNRCWVNDKSEGFHNLSVARRLSRVR